MPLGHAELQAHVAAEDAPLEPASRGSTDVDPRRASRWRRRRCGRGPTRRRAGGEHGDDEERGCGQRPQAARAEGGGHAPSRSVSRGLTPRRCQPTGSGGPRPAGSPQPSTSSFQPAIPLLRLIGQIGATYLVAEGPDGLYLVDQHAAHERVLFEKLMAQHETKNIPAQAPCCPLWELSHFHRRPASLLLSQLPVLQHFGFDVEGIWPSIPSRSASLLLGSYSLEVTPAGLRCAPWWRISKRRRDPCKNELEAKLAARCLQADGGQGGTGLTSDEQRAC